MKGSYFRMPKHEWKRMAGARRGGATVMTTLALVEGEILDYLEQHGLARLRKVVRELEWPTAEVIMGVGALVREGLIEARRDRFGVLLRPC